VTCGELDNRMFSNEGSGRRGRRRSERSGSLREIARDRKARADGVLIHDELIVIPAQSGVDGPVAEVDEVLKKGRLFEVRAAAGEGESSGRTRIEWVVGIGRRIWVGGDEVAEVFVKEKIVGLDAGLPFLMSVVNGDGGIEISLFEVIVLKGSDGPGAAVGIEIVGVVTDHAADIGENVGEKMCW